MTTITPSTLRELSATRQGPCVSLYQPTYRQFPDSRENVVRYRNSLRELESQLASNGSDGARSLLSKFETLATDSPFWNHRTEGLAILASGDRFETFDLQHDVPELLVVSDSFHLKPLFRASQSADRFQILALDRSRVQLYEGNRYALDQIELNQGVPSTLEAALGEEVTEDFVNVASYGGVDAHSGARGAPGMYHGHGDNRDEIQLDVERFFRIVARDVEKYHSNPTQLPLMLAALPEYHAVFRKFSQNRYLMEEGLMFHPDSVSTDQLLAEAWKKIEPYYIKRLQGLIDRYEAAKARNHASDQVADIAREAVAGRVDLLMVEADRAIRGRIDPMSGQVTWGQESDFGLDDVLDDLAEASFRTGAEVIVVPAERMPSTTGAAAVFHD